jgi:hypothetical protein
MSEDIKKLEEVAFKLAERIKQLHSKSDLPTKQDIELADAIEAFKPKAEPPFETWAIIYPDRLLSCYFSEDAASRANTDKTRVAHLREVTPVEWERWCVELGAQIRQGEKHICTPASPHTARQIADAHNEEMQRVTGTEGK